MSFMKQIFRLYYNAQTGKLITNREKKCQSTIFCQLFPDIPDILRVTKNQKVEKFLYNL
jgi:hypothetical protein